MLMEIKPSKKAALPVLALLAAACLLAGPATAQEVFVRVINPKAQELLTQSAATYGALQSYSCRVQTELKMDSVPGSRIIKLDLTFQKPDRAAVAMTEDDETRQFFTNGRSLYVYSADKKEYMQVALPPNVPPTAPVLTQGQSFIGLVLMKPSSLGVLAARGNALSLTLGPPRTLDGAEVRTVTRVVPGGVDGGRLTFSLTIGTKDHLIHRFTSLIVSPKPLPMGASEGDVRRIDNSEIYTDLRVDPALSAASFLPPPDAKKVAPDPH